MHKQGSHFFVRLMTWFCGIAVIVAALLYYVAMSFFPAYVVEYSPWPRLALHAAAFGAGDALLFAEACYHYEEDMTPNLLAYLDHDNVEIRSHAYEYVSESDCENSTYLREFVKRIRGPNAVYDFNAMCQKWPYVAADLLTIYKTFDARQHQYLLNYNVIDGGSTQHAHWSLWIVRIENELGGIIISDEAHIVMDIILPNIEKIGDESDSLIWSLVSYVASFTENSSAEFAFTDEQRSLLMSYLRRYPTSRGICALALLADPHAAMQIIAEDPSIVCLDAFSDINYQAKNFYSPAVKRSLVIMCNEVMRNNADNEILLKVLINAMRGARLDKEFFESLDRELLYGTGMRVNGDAAAFIIGLMVEHDRSAWVKLIADHHDDDVVIQELRYYFNELDDAADRKDLAEEVLPVLRRKLQGVLYRRNAISSAVAGFRVLCELDLYELNDEDYLTLIDLCKVRAHDSKLCKSAKIIFQKSKSYHSRIAAYIEKHLTAESEWTFRIFANEMLKIIEEE